MENMVSFWKGKKVLITGHTGFKGSWLSLWLQLLEAEILGYALAPPTAINLFEKAKVSKNMQDIRGDIRDYSALHKAVSEFQPEIIIHMAAQPLVRYSYTYPVETYATNVMGTVHLLEAARHCDSVRTIVNVTTDKCYENQEWDWGYREIEPMGGFDPYSNSKGCAELVTSAYRRSYFNFADYGIKHRIALASARAGNVIGGGDWAKDRLLPDLVNAAINKTPLEIRYPEAIRPWQHVLEPLSGYLQLARLLYQNPNKYAEAWNFGPHEFDARPVSWIANQVALLLPNLRWIKSPETTFHEATYLKLDCSKAHNKLHWMPQWDISQALEKTISWYQSYYAGMSPYEITIQQIIDYSNQMEGESK